MSCTSPTHSEPESNGNERVLHFPHDPEMELRHQGVGEGATPFPGLLHFTLESYLIMVSAKQGGIKYHF